MSVGPQMIVIQRDSVCAGDDCDAPHEIEFLVNDGEPFESVLQRLVTSGYLPSISGGKATWIVETGKTALAVVAQQWPEAQLLAQSEQGIRAVLNNGVGCHLFLKYWCQVDPDTVLECLRQDRPLPDKYSGAS